MPPGNKHLGHQDHGGSGRIFGLPRPFAWDEAARMLEVGRFDPPHHPRYPDPYIEYTWDPVTKNLIEKKYWADNSKFLQLFTVAYTWDAGTGNLTHKLITREDDGATCTITYTWDPVTGDLVAKEYDLVLP